MTTGSMVRPMVPCGSPVVWPENTPENTIEKRTIDGIKLIEVGQVRVVSSTAILLSASSK